MKKRHFIRILSVAAILMLSVSLFGCGKDSSDGADSPASEAATDAVVIESE